MTNRRTKELVRHTFAGGRFQDHGIDVDAFVEVVRYKNLVIDVAKELWRRNNPGRQRLPKNIHDTFALKFYAVEQNCATIPLMREFSEDDQTQFWESEDELDAAVQLVCKTIDAASEDGAIPDAFPKNILPLFREYGRSLRDDEWIEQKPAGSKNASRYDAVAQGRLIKWISEPYEDTIDVTGEVTMARVNRPRMAIEIAGREVEADFRPEDEEIITKALHDHATAKLHIVGKGQFGADGSLEKIVTVDSIQLLIDGSLPFDGAAKPIWERFAEIASGIPDTELGKLPIDGASRIDDYIYDNGKGN